MPTPPISRKRNPWIAGLLSLFFPGLGHVYVGAARRGVMIVGGVCLIVALLGVAGLLARFWGYAAFAALLLALQGGLLIDVVLLARRRRDYVLKAYNRWPVYLVLALAYLGASGVVSANRGALLGYETYRASSGDMQPALSPGDYFLADTRGYRMGRGGKPARGDVIAFLFPPQPGAIHVKRVVAVGPAKVAIQQGKLVIDGKPVEEPYLRPFGGGASAIMPYSLEMAEVAITADDAFVLGDNRDDSDDSRMWGAVPLENILGRATDIWWSQDRARIGMPVR